MREIDTGSFNKIEERIEDYLIIGSYNKIKNKTNCFKLSDDKTLCLKAPTKSEDGFFLSPELFQDIKPLKEVSRIEDAIYIKKVGPNYVLYGSGTVNKVKVNYIEEKLDREIFLEKEDTRKETTLEDSKYSIERSKPIEVQPISPKKDVQEVIEHEEREVETLKDVLDNCVGENSWSKDNNYLILYKKEQKKLPSLATYGIYYIIPNYF